MYNTIIYIIVIVTVTVIEWYWGDARKLATNCCFSDSYRNRLNIVLRILNYRQICTNDMWSLRKVFRVAVQRFKSERRGGFPTGMSIVWRHVHSTTSWRILDKIPTCWAVKYTQSTYLTYRESFTSQNTPLKLFYMVEADAVPDVVLPFYLKV